MMTTEQLEQFVMHYGDCPFDRPKGRIYECLQSLQGSGWEESAHFMTVAGAVSAFQQLYPVDAPVWKKAFPAVFDGALRIVKRSVRNPDLPAWVDLHMARWGVLRQSVEVDQILKLAGRGGRTGERAQIALGFASREFKEFRESVQDLRKAADLGVLIQ